MPRGSLSTLHLAARAHYAPAAEPVLAAATDGAGLTAAPPIADSTAPASWSQSCVGKPRLIPPWDGSSQREVTTLPRVKKCTPSVPCAWVSPNNEFFQPPNE